MTSNRTTTTGAPVSIDDLLHRTSLIDADHGDEIAYAYLGHGMTVLTDYVRPDIRLDRTVTNAGERTSGKHPAFDRFGRIAEHMWVDGNFELLDEFDPGAGSNIPPVLRITHTYDKASNRLTRYDETPVHAWDHRHQEFEYDGLHRLKTARRGVRDGMTFTHAGGNRTSEQWDLDPIGNQQAVDILSRAASGPDPLLTASPNLDVSCGYAFDSAPCHTESGRALAFG